MKFRFKSLACLLVSLILAFSVVFAGCNDGKPDGGDTEQPPVTNPDKDPDAGDKDPDAGDKDPDAGDKEPDKGDDNPDTGDNDDDKGDPTAVTYRAGYSPEKFSGVTNEVTELGAGVRLVKNKMTKANGQETVVWTVEVDLKQANIVAGSKDNLSDKTDYKHATPYKMAQAWEKDTGGHVYSSLNADFFNQYVEDGKTVNAFVKDGVIVKDGHNDNGNYDYQNDSSDVPASAPLLFGVKGTSAQIAPIKAYEGDVTSAKVKEELVKAKLFYALEHGGKTFEVRNNTEPSNEYIMFNTGTQKRSQRNGCAVKVDTTAGVGALKVLEVKPVSSRENFAGGDGYGWLQATSLSSSKAAAEFLASLKEGDVLSFTVASPDGAWNGFETILGCRQALVLEDKIAETVALENTNGAQRDDIPRSAVGIKPNGTVCVFAVESMYYYSKAQEGDTHGMSLPELAEFAYFYGCNAAANFDGGGSTQLVVRGDKETEAHTVIRSADEGTWGIFDTRPIANAILVTSRKEG